MGEVPFDINAFAKDFWTLCMSMLQPENNNAVLDEIQKCIANRDILNKEPDCVDALREIIVLLKTRGGHHKEPHGFARQWSNFVQVHGHDFRSPEATHALATFISVPLRKKIDALVDYLKGHTIRQFTRHIYDLPPESKRRVLGPKSTDIYLRTFGGYWDRVPIDIHEKRFIVRTGIYHACASGGTSDPDNHAHLQNAIARFCRRFLATYSILGIRLSDAPAIVDIFIWAHCSEERYNICGKIPLCENCRLNKTCLYAISQLSSK